MLYPLNVISIHDHHLFHDNMDTEELIRKLSKVIGDNPDFAKCDVLSFAGDFFDHLVYFNDPDTYLAKRFIRHVLTMCKKYDVALKIVEGTPSHDAKQCQAFEDENESIGARLYYGKTLEIEYDEILDMYTMYVPDQLGDPQTVYESARQLLEKWNLDKVDLIILHGQFRYQFPHLQKIPCHDDELWGELTNTVIFSGHVHKQSQSPNGKVLVAGSFDRMIHGEEGPKGYYNVTFQQNGNHDIKWIENEESFIFKTIDVRYLKPEDTFQHIQEQISKTSEEGSYRILVNKEDSFTQSLQELRKCFPLAKIKMQIEESLKKIEEGKSFELAETTFKPIEITPDNIESLAREELKLKFPEVSDEEIEEILTLIPRG